MWSIRANSARWFRSRTPEPQPSPFKLRHKSRVGLSGGNVLRGTDTAHQRTADVRCLHRLALDCIGRCTFRPLEVSRLPSVPRARASTRNRRAETLPSLNPAGEDLGRHHPTARPGVSRPGGAQLCRRPQDGQLGKNLDLSIGRLSPRFWTTTVLGMKASHPVALRSAWPHDSQWARKPRGPTARVLAWRRRTD